MPRVDYATTPAASNTAVRSRDEPFRRTGPSCMTLRVMASPTPARPAAFFDLDRTLVTVNSGRLWMHREHRLGRINRRQVARGIYYLALYHFGLVNIDRAMGEALETVAGEREEDVRAWTHAWFEEEVLPHAAPGAWPYLEAHRAEGHPLILLTSSSPYASESAVAHFGLDHALSTEFEIGADGRFTGRVAPPVCYGEGKVVRAEALAERLNLDLDRSWFYTDSTTDLPMLERVGFPRPVDPDPRLRRQASRRGWPILSWSRSPPAAEPAMVAL